MANTYLTRTNGTPTNNKIGTFSVWCKRSKLGTDQRFLMNFLDGNNYAYLRFDGSADRLEFFSLNGADVLSLRTNRVFRDTSAWYHIVLKIDMTQATASDRIKFYVNGVEETSFSSTDYGVQNEVSSLFIASGTNYHVVGGAENGTVTFDGSMSHVHFIDGTAYDATAFGEYDANGVWKIKTSPSVTYGTNGFFILKNGNSVTDQSGNGNNFTVAGGTLTKTEDNPSNVFATINSLVNPNSATLSNGNTHSSKSSAHAIVQSTIACGYPNAPSTAKFYWETKMEATDGRTVGLIKSNIPQTSSWYNDYLGENSGGDGVIGYYLGTYVSSSESVVAYNGTTPQITISTGFSTGNVMVHAYDANTGKYWQGKNGVWFTHGGGVGNPATGAYPLVTLNATDREHFIFPAESSQDGRWSWNFGNGYFKTTAVSSAGTNASGIGIFEYDVPTGYTALSTKGLNL